MVFAFDADADALSERIVDEADDVVADADADVVARSLDTRERCSNARRTLRRIFARHVVVVTRRTSCAAARQPIARACVIDPRARRGRCRVPGV